MFLFITLLLYALGLVLTAVGSRLSGRCATWCCALCGFPMWVVSGTVASLSVALPQLVLAFLASGLSITSLAVGAALAGAVTDLGLVLALCLLRRSVTVDRGEFCRKCGILLAACLVLLLFVRDGALSHTGAGLLMALFVLFVMESIVYQYRLVYDEDLQPIGVGPNRLPRSASVPASQTMAFPAMSPGNAVKNLAGVLGGLALLLGGAWALLYSATALANLTGTIQALWAATLISFGFSLPLLAEVLHHPFGSVWKRFAVRCRIHPPAALPMQMLNSAILSLTFVLPLCSLTYRARLPVGAQFRAYDVPVCVLLGLVLLVPPLFRRRLYRWQGGVCLGLYLLYLAAVLLAPRAGA